MAGEWQMRLVDQPPADVTGALGYHDRQPDGAPILYVFTGLCAQENVSWTSCASHEICEALADPYLRRCVQAPDGGIWALEACDACETIGYNITVAAAATSSASPAGPGSRAIDVEVSDFCTPSWFEPRTDGQGKIVPGQRYNWLNTIKEPFGILSGGYAQTFTDDAGWAQLGPTQRRAYRSTLAILGLSRGRRRG
jgi:hypothetical protein